MARVVLEQRQVTAGKNMECPECGTSLVIDEWGGWQWTCFHCDFVGRYATNKEIEQYEKGVAEFLENEQSENSTGK